MKNISTKWRLIFALSTCAFVLFLAYRVNSIKKDASGRDEARAARQVLENWNSFSYISVKNPELRNNLKAFVQKFGKNATLTEPQEEKLIDSISAFCHAYSDGEFRSYKSFRMPAGFSYTYGSNLYGSLRDFFKQGPRFGSQAILTYWEDNYTDDKDIFKFPVPEQDDEKFKIFLEVYSNKNLFKDYLAFIALEQSDLVISNYNSTVPNPWDLNFASKLRKEPAGYVVKAGFPNLGFGSQKQNSYVKLDESSHSTVAKNGSVLICDAFLFVKHGQMADVRPMIVRWVWSERVQSWYPEDLVLCNLYQLQSSFPIF